MTNKTKIELLRLFDQIDSLIDAEKIKGWGADFPGLLKQIEARLRKAANKKGLSVRVRTRMVKLADTIKDMRKKRKK